MVDKQHVCMQKIHVNDMYDHVCNYGWHIETNPRFLMAHLLINSLVFGQRFDKWYRQIYNLRLQQGLESLVDSTSTFCSICINIFLAGLFFHRQIIELTSTYSFCTFFAASCIIFKNSSRYLEMSFWRWEVNYPNWQTIIGWLKNS